MSESEATPSAPTKKRPFYRRRGFLVTVAVLVVLFGAILALLPHAISYGVARWITENGGGEVSVGNVDFNPFTGKLALQKLSVRKDDAEPLLLPELALELSWRPLMEKEVVVTGIGLQGVRLTVDRSDQGVLQVGGIVIPQSPDETELDEKVEKAPWGFEIEDLEIADTEVHYRDALLDTRVRVDELELTGLASFKPEQAASLVLKGSVDGSPVDLDGQLLVFSDQPAFEGALNVEGLDLNQYEKLAQPAVANLAGFVGMNTRIEASYDPQQGIKVRQDGTLSLGQADTRIGTNAIQTDHFRWDGKLDVAVPLEEGPLDLTADGTLDVGPLGYSETEQNLQVEQDGLQWKGRLTYRVQAGSTTIGTDSDLGLQGIRYSQPDQKIQVTQQKLAWNGAIGVDIGAGSTGVNVDGKLEAGGLDTELDSIKIAVAALNLPDASLKLTTNPAGNLDLAHKGPITVDSFSLEQAAPDSMKVGAAKIDMPELELTLATADAGSVDVTHKGQLSVGSFSLEQPEQTVEQEQLAWQGSVSFGMGNERPMELTTDGALSGTKFGIRLPRRDAKIDYGALDWKGRLGFDLADELNGLDVDGNFKLTGFASSAPGKNFTLAVFDTLEIEGLKSSGPKQVSAKNLGVQRILLGREEGTGSKGTVDTRPLLDLGKLEVNDLEFSEKGGVRVASIVETDLNTVILHEKDGTWNVIGLVTSVTDMLRGESDPAKKSEEATPAKQTEAKETGEPMPIRIGDIRLAGESSLTFEDETLAPPFTQTMKIDSAKWSKLDSTKPDQLSPIELKTTLAGNGSFTLSGGIALFAERLTLDLKGDVEGLQMAPLSSYTIPMLGYRMDAGEMDADIILDAKAGKLKGDNTMYIHQLEISSVKQKPAKGEQGSTVVPLEAGLAMLRDKHNTIKLELPISGDVDDIKVNPADIINQALATAMQAGAKTYLAAALFPFGTVLTVAQIAGEEAMKVRLDPLKFAPGSTALNDQGKEYLGKVASVLKERPEIHLKVCGRAVPSDRTALQGKKEAASKDTQATQGERKGTETTGSEGSPPPSVSDEALQQLAQERAAQVENYLYTEHKVSGGRLINCRPKVEQDQTAEPRTELLL